MPTPHEPPAPVARPKQHPLRKTLAGLRREWPLEADLLTAALFLFFGRGWLADLSNPFWYAFLLTWLFAVILAAAFAVVRHAEALAEMLGEPLGTLILTLAVTGIEVMMITAVMYSGHGHPTLARDAMFAVVMIVLNGMVGLSLLLGGLRYREQTYNLQGANSFLAVILPITVIGLVLPNFTESSPGPTYSPFHATFLIVLFVGLYGVFLAIQNVRHREYFLQPGSGEGAHTPHARPGAGPVVGHAGLLVAYMLPMVFLAEQLAVPIDYGIETLHAPPAVGGFLVSVLVLSPESMAAARAALANQLQRAVNVLLGSVVATISLTGPSVLAIGFFTGKQIVLGLEPAGITLLALTLGVSMLTFGRARTNVLFGAVHLLLFLAYLMLLFEK
jgi:Ca2+:H+ antiporter